MSQPDPERDQTLAEVRDSLPKLWWALYAGSLDAGFSSSQSLALVQTFILSQTITKMLPPDAPERGAPNQE